MFLLILKIAAGISLLPFLLVFIASLITRLRIPPHNPTGFSWEQVGIYKEDGSVTAASGLIKSLKRHSKVLISAVGIIALGFIFPIVQPDAFKNIDQYHYLTLGIGFVAGWIAVFGCRHYISLVKWNLLGDKPPWIKENRNGKG